MAILSCFLFLFWSCQQKHRFLLSYDRRFFTFLYSQVGLAQYHELNFFFLLYQSVYFYQASFFYTICIQTRHHFRCNLTSCTTRWQHLAVHMGFHIQIFGNVTVALTYESSTNCGGLRIRSINFWERDSCMVGCITVFPWTHSSSPNQSKDCLDVGHCIFSFIQTQAKFDCGSSLMPIHDLRFTNKKQSYEGALASLLF